MLFCSSFASSFINQAFLTKNEKNFSTPFRTRGPGLFGELTPASNCRDFGLLPRLSDCPYYDDHGRVRWRRRKKDFTAYPFAGT
jgi:hypothetical protein